MIRHRLSQLFTRYAARYVPGDKFFGKTSAELMDANRDHYRDTLIAGLQTIFTKFDNKLVMETEKTGTGSAVLKLSSPITYPGFEPVEFQLSTETSDFLMATGREAVFSIEKDGETKLFYYGNSWDPDNHSQFLGMPRYIAEVQDVAQHLNTKAYADLYARYLKNKPQGLESKP